MRKMLSAILIALVVVIGLFGSTTASNLPIAYRGFLGGMTLSNDSGTPLTVLDISTGYATDSTNSTLIVLNSAFTKSVSGSWVAGSGANGMGTGLTVTAQNWYHVCAIIVSFAADIYFDTDAACTSHSPVGVTARRRIGSILTDASAHINGFLQKGDEFFWGTGTAIIDVQVSNPGATATTRTITAPPGVVTEYIMYVQATIATGATNEGVLVSPVNVAAVTPTSLISTVFLSSAQQQAVGAQARCLTNTSQQVRTQNINGGTNATVVLTAIGYRDFLGRFD